MIESNFFKQNTLPTSSQAEQVPSKIPEKIGPYAIETLLEKGGMSYLYLATHPDTHETITIKALFPEFASNPEMVQRFLREAEIIEMADHPNIVKLYGQGQWEGGLYIAMEFIQGISLRQYLLRNLISLKHALELILEISIAICHLHAHGVIHRDLKPENILITEGQGIKVIDFGIAQLLTDAPSSEAAKKRLIGTPIYMSPEQRENPESTSYPSDIYSLGIITYELVLGKLSHGQIHLTLMPKGLQKILTKALQQKPQDRYQDIVDFMTDISTYLHSPAMMKESKDIDPLNDLSESLRHAQQSLIPHTPPTWNDIEIGLASFRSLGISSLYYDFFSKDDENYGIVISEPSLKGAPGIVFSSVFRGMMRALSTESPHPEEVAGKLHHLLVDDPIKQDFNFAYLTLSPKENIFRFISCGCGQLWLIRQGSKEIESMPSNNPILGVDRKAVFNEVTHPWNVGDTLIFYAFLTPDPSEKDVLFSPEQFHGILKENVLETPQKQVDTLLRSAKIRLSRKPDNRAVILLSLLRKENQATCNPLPT